MGRLDDVLARGTVSAADGTKKMRVVQVRLLADEVRDDLEHVEPYGFTSEPLDDEQPEAFAAFFSGDRSHGIVFCIADRRYRLTKLKAGEVALYDDQGQKVHLTRDGIVVHTDKQLEATVGGTLTATVSGAATLKAASVKIDAPTVELTGALKVAKLITGTAAWLSPAAVARPLPATSRCPAVTLLLTVSACKTTLMAVCRAAQERRGNRNRRT